MIYKLFYRRWLQQIQHKCRTLSLFYDWTVLVYFIIPGSLFLAYQTIEYYRGDATWYNGYEAVLAFVTISLFLFASSLSTYLEETDLIYIRRKISNLKVCSLIYYFIKMILLATVVILLLKPLSIDVKWIQLVSGGMGLGLCIYYVEISRLPSLIKNGIKWVSPVLLAFLYMTEISPVIILLPSWFMFLIAVYKIFTLQNSMDEVQLQARHAGAFSKGILQGVGVMEAPNTKVKPLITRLPIKEPFTRLGLLVLIRNRSKRNHFFLLFFTCGNAILFAPTVIKVIVIIFGSIACRYFVFESKTELMKHDFYRMHKGD